MGERTTEGPVALLSDRLLVVGYELDSDDGTGLSCGGAAGACAQSAAGRLGEVNCYHYSPGRGASGDTDPLGTPEPTQNAPQVPSVKRGRIPPARHLPPEALHPQSRESAPRHPEKGRPNGSVLRLFPDAGGCYRAGDWVKGLRGQVAGAALLNSRKH